MADLHGKRVAMVVGQAFEDSEATEPKQFLEGNGATVTVIGLTREPVKGKKGAILTVDKTFDEVSPEQFDALVIPGGGSPENLRIDDRAVAFTRAFVESGKPVASICHGPQLLISADVLRGRTSTCVNKIRDDVRNAGATYVDEPVVVDGNLISSRTPADLPQFHAAMAKALAGVPAAAR